MPATDVSANNLTRDEAGVRAGLLEVSSYVVELDFTDGAGRPGEQTFASSCTIRFGAAEPGATTHLDLTAPAVGEITLNGASLDPARVFDGNRIALPELAQSNELRVVADCAYMRTGEGLHRFVDPVDGATYLYTQFETFDAHRVYACFDQPDLKATFELTVTAPADWTVVSNTAAASPEVAPNGSLVHRFAPTPRMSTYITALVAGPYHVARDEHDGIPLGIYCRSSLAGHLDAEALFAVTKQGFDFFQREFDYPYPFDKYDQLFVPEFNAGAMENAGAVTFRDDYVFRSKVTDASYERRAETILHEMAHMWFGDLVTMRWWDDLWLNESFATFASVLCQSEATRWTSAWTTFANVEKSWAYRQDQLSSTHPIAADASDIEAVKVNFDGITYAKGASVLKQLVAWVGREQFFDGLRAYFRRFAYANTSLADLLAELEAASGRDLSAWTKEWLQTAGVTTLRPRFETDDAGAFTSFSIAQEAPAEHPTLRSHRVAVGLYDLGPSGLQRRERVELDVTGAVTQVSQLVGTGQPDLVLVNDDDLSYAKIRLDQRSLRTLVDHIGDIAESLPRALGWAAAWDMTRDAELASRDYLALVLNGIGQESDIGLVQSVLRLAQSALDTYSDPANREPGHRALADRLLTELRAAEPGSDRQLAFTRAFAISTSTPEHQAVLRDMLAGTADVPGLEVDTDLRWHLLIRLVELGAAGDGEIDAELTRDATSAGQRQAAAARAARPTPVAKEEAWRAAVDSDELPNALQAATIGGFMQPDQIELLAPYRDRYFAAVGTVWAKRTAEMAQNVVVGLYPRLLISPDTVEATESYLRTEQPPPALRRLLEEGRDGISRALHAREKDVAARS